MKNRGAAFYELVLLVVLLMSTVALSINIFLPAFESTALDLQLKEKTQIQSGIALLYLGLGISQLIYGPLSDSIGRRPTIQIGLSLFLTGCLTSFCASNLFILILGQLIQGLGLGAPRALSIAIVRDRFSGNYMASVISLIMILYILVPILSPILGKLILTYSHWRTIFLFLLLFGAVVQLAFFLRMPETLSPQKQQSFSLRHICQSTAAIFNQKKTMGYILILGLYSGVFIAYMNLSQSIFEFQYQLGKKYPLYFAVLASSIGFASFLNGKIVLQLKAKNIVRYVLITETLSAALFLLAYALGQQSLLYFLIFMFLQLMGYGFLIGNLSSLAMETLGNIAGLGASIIGAISTVIAVPTSLLVAQSYQESTLPLLWGFLSAGIISILIFKYINKQKSILWKGI